MRFQLVPKVTKEVDFWKNYFYRISLIKQSAEPIEAAVEIIQVWSLYTAILILHVDTDYVIQDEEGTEDDTAEEIKNLEEEFASEEVGTKSEEIPQWEKELQDELQVRANFYIRRDRPHKWCTTACSLLYIMFGVI